jgi:hypothetical protein
MRAVRLGDVQTARRSSVQRVQCASSG